MDKTPKNTIIDVIPLTRLPLSGQQSFSYIHPEKIPFGSLVSIPLFRREVRGIVIGNRDDFFRFGNIKLRKVNNILDESLITEKQLEIAKFVSDYYICPLGIVLKFFVVKKTKQRKIGHETLNTEKSGIKLSKEQRVATNSILKNKEALLIAGKEKIEIYLELIKRNVATGKQVLLLVPEVPLAYHAFDIIAQQFNENEIALFHSRLTAGELYRNYKRIQSGEAKIVIGTRQAVFAPFLSLGLIIVDEEQDISHKQWDMNPRYNAKNVAHMLAGLHKATLLLSSVAPSIETYYHMRNESVKIKNELQAPEIINMRNEGWTNGSKRNRDIMLSKKLIAEVGWALKSKKQVFLFSNRRGMSSFSVCTECKEVLRCPRCQRALVYDKKGYYRCLHCSHKTDIFASCQKCGSNSFRDMGIGNQTVEKEVEKFFPGARIKLIDAESLQDKSSQRELFRQIEKGAFDILIGTQLVIKAWKLSRIGLIGIIRTDDLLYSAEFNTSENVFQILTEATQKSAENRGSFIIQTYTPENDILKYVKDNDRDSFYEKILAERKSLKYPPFCRIIKLTLRTPSKEKMEKESVFMFGRLNVIFKDDTGVSVFEPFTPQLSKVRDAFRKNIIIKLMKAEIPQELEKTLKNLSSEWIIDVDPISIA